MKVNVIYIILYYIIPIIGRWTFLFNKYWMPQSIHIGYVFLKEKDMVVGGWGPLNSQTRKCMPIFQMIICLFICGVKRMGATFGLGWKLES